MTTTNKVCVICDTMGCCNSNEQHTYDNTCLASKKQTPEEVAEMERLKAMYDNTTEPK